MTLNEMGEFMRGLAEVLSALKGILALLLNLRKRADDKK